MQLPRGTLARSSRGPVTLASVTEEIARENLTGYLRVSILSGNPSECVVVYLGAKPVMAFVTKANDEKPDAGLITIAAAIQQPGAFIEVYRLGDKQVSLLQELYDSFRYTEPLPPPQPRAPEKPAAAAKPQGKAAETPVQEKAATAATAARPHAPYTMPEIRGRFVRSEELADLRDYSNRYPADTGHLLFIAGQNGAQTECHAILLNGRIEAVYDEHTIAAEVPARLAGIPGIAEFYAVDQTILTSVLKRYLKASPETAKANFTLEKPAVMPEPKEPAPQPAREQAKPAPAVPAPVQAQPEKPPVETPRAPQPAPEPARPEPAERPKTIGVSARTILEKSRFSEAAHVEDDINRTVDEISKSMDDDIAMVRKVEQDFACHAEELLEKLDLGHLRRDRRK